MKADQRSKLWFIALIIIITFTFLALLFTPQTYLVNTEAPRPLSWGEAFAANAVLFYMWALLTPAILWLGKRFPIERQHLAKNFTILFILAIPFTFAHLVLIEYGNFFFLSWIENYQAPVPVKALAVGLGATDIMIYWGILGCAQALNYFAKYQEREYRLVQAQLQALKMQLHPHFLFNTLNAISELVYDAPEVADKTINRLSDLLRLSLKSGRAEEVTLKEEIEFLEKYLEIQQILLQERLSIKLAIDHDALDACVPNMILQPLVENAIKHGIAPRISGGCIEVSAQREDRLLRLYVRDNGLGMPIDQPDMIKNGIGLANTQARLQHLYGSAHQFKLSESPDGGLTVSMAIPFRELLLEGSN